MIKGQSPINVCPIDCATSEDVIWLSGFLEGEGTFRYGGRRKKCGAISVGSSDKDVLERASCLMGGHVYEDTSPSSMSRKTIWRCSISGYRARRTMEEVLPHMGSRRAAKIQELLAISGWGFLR